MKVGVILGMIELFLYVVDLVVFDSKEQTVVHQIMLCKEFFVLFHDFLDATSVLLSEFQKKLLGTLYLDVLILEHSSGLDSLEFS